MRIALIADIHGNLPALEAVLSDIKRHAPDRIISLGDQVNLGPCPQEVLALLKEENVLCLHGNHERYIASVLAGDPAYDGANFHSLRFNAAQLTTHDVTHPRELRIEGMTLCHAMPHDDRFPVHDPPKALPLLRKMTFDSPTHIICGHGHNPSHIRMHNLTINCIGSTGCMDDGPAGITSYTLLDTARDGAALRPIYIPYDTGRLKPLFKASGMLDFCPIIARVACIQMEHNHDYLVPFVTHAFALAAEKNESGMPQHIWELADKLFPWPDSKSTAEYWK